MLSHLQCFSFITQTIMGRHIIKLLTNFINALPHAIACRSYRALPCIITSIFADSYIDNCLILLSENRNAILDTLPVWMTLLCSPRDMIIPHLPPKGVSNKGTSFFHVKLPTFLKNMFE